MSVSEKIQKSDQLALSESLITGCARLGNGRISETILYFRNGAIVVNIKLLIAKTVLKILDENILFTFS